MLNWFHGTLENDGMQVLQWQCSLRLVLMLYARLKSCLLVWWCLALQLVLRPFRGCAALSKQRSGIRECTDLVCYRKNLRGNTPSIQQTCDHLSDGICAKRMLYMAESLFTSKWSFLWAARQWYHQRIVMKSTQFCETGLYGMSYSP